MSRRVSQRELDRWYRRRWRLLVRLPASLTWSDRRWAQEQFDLCLPPPESS